MSGIVCTSFYHFATFGEAITGKAAQRIYQFFLSGIKGRKGINLS
jgi:hypothetical protein